MFTIRIKKKVDGAFDVSTFRAIRRRRNNVPKVGNLTTFFLPRYVQKLKVNFYVLSNKILTIKKKKKNSSRI